MKVGGLDDLVLFEPAMPDLELRNRRCGARPAEREAGRC